MNELASVVLAEGHVVCDGHRDSGVRDRLVPLRIPALLISAHFVIAVTMFACC